jgi:hypothetical protein
MHPMTHAISVRIGAARGIALPGTTHMKKIRSVLLLLLAVATGLILYTVMSDDDATVRTAAEPTIDAALPAEEQAAIARQQRIEGARSTCSDALLAAIENPESARVAPPEEWRIDEPADGTILVRLSAQITTAMGMEIDGTWDCVVLPDREGGMRLVSLTLVDSS